MVAGDSLVDVLLEFLEALVHQVLFVRELYSPELFERQRLYGIAVRRARHPDLAAYISDAVAGLKVCVGGVGGVRGHLERAGCCYAIRLALPLKHDWMVCVQAQRLMHVPRPHPLAPCGATAVPLHEPATCRPHWPAAVSPRWQ